MYSSEVLCKLNKHFSVMKSTVVFDICTNNNNIKEEKRTFIKQKRQLRICCESFIIFNILDQQ